MPDKPTQAQIDRARRIIAFEQRDPLTGDRHCRWCLLKAPVVLLGADGEVASRPQDGGEYLCPQCGRWQNERAFPDGVPGLTQEASGG